MSSKKKQEARFSLDSPVITVGKESTTVSTRSETKTEKSIIPIRKPLRVPPNLLPYTPPDALMFALFSAIDRKAWPRARKLCHELILCDPLRKNYHDLYSRIDQIVKMIDQRTRPKVATIIRTPTAASSGNSSERTTSRR